ncbi:Pectinesterase, catalytic [Corchorus capsularis]|uniref:Pectinesterase, catalytic n=1 Tax=Corchorus capsularis TaxID=210143 RepID=A0A1R3H9Z1_COCAP|nr:Pectinesterase, catalytic [Corchorus capsularis]
MLKFSTSSFLVLVFVLGLFTATPHATSISSNADFLGAECLNVPATEFVNSLRTTIDGIRKVTSIVSQFGSFFGDFRLGNAINDCLDLLDFSAEELSWTMSASQSPNGKHNSTGDLASDLRTWLSAAMANHETCIDGFEGTNSIVKTVVAGSLNQVTSLVSDLLTMVDPGPSSKSNGGGGGHVPGKKLSNKNQFPAWFKREDRKLLMVDGVQADVVVAADGTGNFTKIMDAIAAAPDNSMSRFVIYIKKGLYNENVEIKKKKWNLMMVGDGMDVTIISGNRSFIDGWTTFRSATFV